MLKKIRELRLQGKSLGEIANALDKSPSTVKRYLKKNNLRLTDLKMKCSYCGKEFIPDNANKRYCCRDCALKSNQDKSNKNKKKYPRYEGDKVLSYNRERLNNYNIFVCSECGSKEFISDLERNEKYCKNCGLIISIGFRLK